MVSFKFTALALGATLLAEAVMASPASHLAAIRRDRRLALRQNAGEAYPNDEPATCASGLDTQNPDGTCMCGPGRVQASDNTCELSPAAQDSLSDYAVFNLAAPVHLAFAITSSYPISAPADVLTPRQCAAVCEVEAACIGFYLQPGNDLELSQCWKIGGDGAYSDPRTTGIPFTADSTTKRDDAVSGSIGAPGGVLGIAAMPTDGSSADNTCTQGVDTRNADGTCTCGAGRVSSSDADTGCKTAPSAAARARRARRDSFQGVQW